MLTGDASSTLDSGSRLDSSSSSVRLVSGPRLEPSDDVRDWVDLRERDWESEEDDLSVVGGDTDAREERRLKKCF